MSATCASARVLDFLGGAQRRAPVFMQRYGLEWLWRVALSPSRLGARYARCAVLLAKAAGVTQPASCR
jgi:UDP-N-acetyl-D-mannosaminuronic acid transferase (WecB/TagA/CpsF family)